jgi:hypothetical protein
VQRRRGHIHFAKGVQRGWCTIQDRSPVKVWTVGKARPLTSWMECRPPKARVCGCLARGCRTVSNKALTQGTTFIPSQ